MKSQYPGRGTSGNTSNVANCADGMRNDPDKKQKNLSNRGERDKTNAPVFKKERRGEQQVRGF